MSFTAILLALDVFGVAVFAASGALTASRKEMDLVGFILIAIVTGIGGGTIRDLLLDRGAVFWIQAPWYLWLCAAVATVVFALAPRIESRREPLLWADAIGLATFSVLGAATAAEAGTAPGVTILMGAITATFGGLIRDVLCAEVPLILRREIYLTAAAAGAFTYVVLDTLSLPHAIALLAGFLVALGLRAVGLIFKLSLPRYRPRPGRPFEP